MYSIGLHCIAAIYLEFIITTDRKNVPFYIFYFSDKHSYNFIGIKKHIWLPNKGHSFGVYTIHVINYENYVI